MSECAEKGEENAVFLEELPTEILLTIFKFCTLRALGNLCQTCKRLNGVVSDFIWYGRSRKVIATNQISPDIQIRSSHLLSSSNKCRIATNWIKGRYLEKIYYPFKTKHMPWLVLEQNSLWLSKGKYIRGLQRRSNGLAQSAFLTLKGHEDDVCRFVSTDDLIISGGRDGCVCGWSRHTGKLEFKHTHSHTSDVVAVDVCGEVIVSASQDGIVKVTSFSEQIPQLNIEVRDRVWSLAVQPLRDLCCIGTAGYNQVPPLHLYDLEQGHEVVRLQQSSRVGAGVLDIHWESPHELLAGGYDTCLRLWDIRTGCRELVWEDPYDCAIYSIASDNSFTILCGMSLHGRVHLWDKRRHRDVGKFFMAARCSSPVYSLAFDPCKLFAVLDLSLHVLDFSVFKNTPGVKLK